MDAGSSESWGECCLRLRSVALGIRCPHPPWCLSRETSNGGRGSAKWSDQSWGLLIPVYCGEALSVYWASPKKRCRCGQRASVKEARGFAFGTEKTNSDDPVTGSRRRDQGHATDALGQRSIWHRVYKVPLLMAPNMDYPRRIRAKQRLNPKLIVFKWEVTRCLQLAFTIFGRSRG